MDTYRQQNQVETITGSSEDSLHTATTAAAWCDPSAYPLTLSSVSDQALSACAIKAVHQKQYAWALHLLNQLIQRHPQEANFYSNRGLLHLWCGHPDTALNDCNYAIELKPDLDQAYNNRANCYAALGLSVKALVDYERAVDFNPFNSRARINLGVTLRHLGDLDAALECFDEALLFYKLSAIIYTERGRTYHLRGDWNCAIADYRRALTVLAQGSETPQQKRLQKRIQAWIDDLLPEPDQP